MNQKPPDTGGNCQVLTHLPTLATHLSVRTYLVNLTE